jgi:hypothetical protein
LPDDCAMTLRIENRSDGRRTVLHLSGRIAFDHIEELQAEIAGVGGGKALDLEYVTRVDIEGVRFLSECEREGNELVHCSQYLREWIDRERFHP